MTREHENCATCICGRRAPVQATNYNNKRGVKKGPGTISWAEHLEAWTEYARQYGTSQSAERMAERCGFDYLELLDFLGHEPKTWEPLR